MTTKRCPYHVRQGHVNEKGQLVVSDLCGLKAAKGSHCKYLGADFKDCSQYLYHHPVERHVLVPQHDIEYLPEMGQGAFAEKEVC